MELLRAMAAIVRKSAYATRLRTRAEKLHKDAEALSMEISYTFVLILAPQLTGNSHGGQWQLWREEQEGSTESLWETNAELGSLFVFSSGTLSGYLGWGKCVWIFQPIFWRVRVNVCFNIICDLWYLMNIYKNGTSASHMEEPKVWWNL